MKLRILIVTFFTCFAVSASEAPKKLSLNEMVELSDAIALVKILEYSELKDHLGVIYKKNLTVEVIDPILNLSQGERIVLLGQNGINGSDIEFQTVGDEAIILMSLTSRKTNGMNIYNSVGARYSVFKKVSKNCIKGLGFWGTDTSYDKAVSKLKEKISE